MSTNDPFDDVGGIEDDFSEDQDQSQEVGGSGDPTDGPAGGGGDGGGDDGGGFTGGGGDGVGSNDDDDDPFDVGGVEDDFQRDQEESRQVGGSGGDALDRASPGGELPERESPAEPPSATDRARNTDPSETEFSNPVDTDQRLLLGPDARGNPLDSPAVVEETRAERGSPAGSGASLGGLGGRPGFRGNTSPSRTQRERTGTGLGGVAAGAATDFSADQQRSRRLGGTGDATTPAEEVGSQGVVERFLRERVEDAQQASEQLGDSLVGLTTPEINTDGVDDILEDGRADEPIISATPEEAGRDNETQQAIESAGETFGATLFGTLPSAGVFGIEAGEAGANVAGGVGRDARQLVTGADPDPDATQAAVERVETSVREGVDERAQAIGAVTETNPDAFEEIAATGRADEPLFAVKEDAQAEVGGALVGAAAGSAAAAPATAPVSPLQVTRFDVPVDDGGVRRVSAVRTRVPGVQDRTIAATVGGRPQAGSPRVDLQDVDINRLGEARGEVFEPVGEFETDLTVASERASLSGQQLDRVEGITGVLGVGDEATEEVRDLRGAVDAAEDLPNDADTDEVIGALDDVDATIFGSAAVRAQAPEFRDPGDLDIVVPDKDAAKDRLADVVGEEQVARAFDIKEPDDFAGLQEGEAFGFGRESREPLEAEGVGVNPIGEELQRKAGASGFLRGESVGPAELDVGPRPNPGGSLRVKDPEDALEIARAVAGEDDPRVQQFERAFFGADGEADVPDSTVVAGLRDFLADERASVQVPRGRPRQPELDVDDVADPEVDVATRRLFGDDDDSPSPTLESDRDTSPVPAASAGAGTSAAAGGGSSLFGSAGTTFSTDTSTLVGGAEDASPASTPTGAADTASRLLGSPETRASPATSTAPGGSPLPSFGPGGSSPGSGGGGTSSPIPSPGSPGDGGGGGGGPTPSDRTPRRPREEEDEESDDESAFALFGSRRDFGTGIADVEDLREAGLLGDPDDSQDSSLF